MSGMSDNDCCEEYTDDDSNDGSGPSPSSSSMDAFDYVNPNPGSFNMKVYGMSSPIPLEKKQRADRHAATSDDRIPLYVPDSVLAWGWECTSCSRKIDKQPRQYENGVEPVWWWWCHDCRFPTGGSAPGLPAKGGSAHSRTGLKQKDDTPRGPVKDTKKKPASAPTKTQKTKIDMAARCKKITFSKAAPKS